MHVCVCTCVNITAAAASLWDAAAASAFKTVTALDAVHWSGIHII